METVEIQWMKYLANGNPNRDSGNPVETVEIQWVEIQSIDCHIQPRPIQWMKFEVGWPLKWHCPIYMCPRQIHWRTPQSKFGKRGTAPICRKLRKLAADVLPVGLWRRTLCAYNHTGRYHIPDAAHQVQNPRYNIPTSSELVKTPKSNLKYQVPNPTSHLQNTKTQMTSTNYKAQNTKSQTDKPWPIID